MLVKKKNILNLLSAFGTENDIKSHSPYTPHNLHHKGQYLPICVPGICFLSEKKNPCISTGRWHTRVQEW